MIETAAVDRLKQEGLGRGGLTLEDIQKRLPLDVMTTEELAAVLMQLEDAGVTVDVDPALLANRGRIVDIHERRADHAAALDSGQTTAAPQDELSRVGSEINAEQETVARRQQPPRKNVPVLAVAILVVVVVIVLFLIFGL